MKNIRSSGILVHPTSFSGTPGIGTFGAPSYKFVDWLFEAGQTLWQILPLDLRATAIRLTLLFPRSPEIRF